MRILAFLPVAAALCHADPVEQRWSIEGHARTMYESYHGLDFGLGSVDDDDWIHQRVQAMFAWDPDPSLRLAAELTWGRMW